MSVLTAAKTMSVLLPSGVELGTVSIDDIEDGRISGEFASSPGFAAVESIFRFFTEVVEQQSFSYLDQVESEIARLGITICWKGHSDAHAVHDVQIYTDGGFSCRLLNPNYFGNSP